MAFDACRATVADLKQVIERFMASHEQLSSSILTMDELQTLCEEVNVMESSLRDALGESYFREGISEVVVSLKEDLDVLLRKEKLYANATLMESLLRDSLGDGYDRSQIREAVDSTKMDVNPLFLRKEFREICDKVNVVESLSWEGYDCFLGPIRDLMIPIKTKLKKELGPVFRKEFQILYKAVDVMDSLLTDSLRQTCNCELMETIHDRIKAVADQVANDTHFLADHREGPVMSTISGEERVCVEGSLLKMAEEVAWINEELMECHKKSNVIGQTVPKISDDLEESSTGELIGHKSDFYDMRSKIIYSSEEGLEFVSITGMAGIGKTYFAKELYNDPLVIEIFDVRAWVKVSQKYRLRELLLALLSRMMCLSADFYEGNDDRLKELLNDALQHKRYLILLDDVWDERILRSLERTFPDNHNRSKILVTTRHRLDGGPYRSTSICLQFLTQDESWKLLCSKIFGKETCPDFLIPIVERIAYGCHGVPLALVTAGQLLSKMEKTSEVFEEVAQNVWSFLINYRPFYDILAFSYNDLPDPQKTCFLHMGHFLQEYEISLEKLTSLWIAEGLVPGEDIAKDYLDYLNDRGLIMMKRRGSTTRIKIHDCWRDLCLRESQKMNFIRVFPRHYGMKMKYAIDLELYDHRWFTNNNHWWFTKRRPLAIHSDLGMFLKSGASFPPLHSFFCSEVLKLIHLEDCSRIFFKALEILDMPNVELISLPSWLKYLSKLKYLSLTIQDSVSLIELSKLCSMQTCIIDGKWNGELCREFWDMSELRHICLKRALLQSHSGYSFKGKFPTLWNLQSLSTVAPASCTKKIFLSMPNLTKLGVCATNGDQHRFGGWFKNLVHLRKLKTLKVSFSGVCATNGDQHRFGGWFKNLVHFGGSHKIRHECLPSCNVFPPNLVNLTLSGTSLQWEDMHKLSMLPNLRALKLKNIAFSGAIYEMGETCFMLLEFLLIDSTDLKVWKFGRTNFPQLHHLVLRHCRSLGYLPYFVWIGEVELHSCSDSIMTQARQILHDEAYWEPHYGPRELHNGLKLHVT